MSQAVAVAGPMKEYVSKIEFSLNFEERDKAGKQVSAKIKINDHVFYDGLTAKCKKPNGDEIVGKTSSLNSAIASNWLYLVGTQPGPVNMKVPGGEYISKTPDYDSLRGGDFDSMLSQEFKATKVIKEEDLIVKKTAKMEVSNDQREVKAVTVSSSTAVPETRASKKVTVTQSDAYGADHSIDVSMKRTSEKTEEKPKANTFTVDQRTPRPSDDATLTEVKRVMVTQADGSQDARVVSKVGDKRPRQKMEVEHQDARVIGRVKTGEVVEEGIIFNKPAAPKEKSDVTTTAGSTPVADLSEAKTQKDVEIIEKAVTKKASTAASTANYLDMLPEDWATMHWVKKENFIKTITDKEFINFILRVESTKAVQLACKRRLAELAKL